MDGIAGRVSAIGDAGVYVVLMRTTILPDDGWQTEELARRYAASGRCHTYSGDWTRIPAAVRNRVGGTTGR
jgi:hypothetical protein